MYMTGDAQFCGDVGITGLFGVFGPQGAPPAAETIGAIAAISAAIIISESTAFFMGTTNTYVL
jgi:hypothetical protein